METKTKIKNYMYALCEKHDRIMSNLRDNPGHEDFEYLLGQAKAYHDVVSKLFDILQDIDS